MSTRQARIISAILCFTLILWLMGCEAIMAEHRGAAVGTGACATTGTVAGAAIGKGAGAAIIGGFIEGLLVVPIGI